MNNDLQTFQIYVVGTGSPDRTIALEASDPFTAAQIYLAQAGNISTDIEIAVISPNGFEDVYGYRSIVPQAHLDD